ncbi:MAG: sel1 repeat family protein, partial [Rhodospirillales bacterium]|nr:sel1 repeat family protein [Rhodospirillales bacterium]
RKAAEQGHATAQYNLGSMYQKGAAMPQDFAQAARWHRQAAEQGDPRAQLELGLLYARGEGVRKDLIKAYKWINLASAMAPLGETRALSTKARNFLERRMSRPDITKSQRLSRDWMTKHRAKK